MGYIKPKYENFCNWCDPSPLYPFTGIYFLPRGFEPKKSTMMFFLNNVHNTQKMFNRFDVEEANSNLHLWGQNGDRCQNIRPQQIQPEQMQASCICVYVFMYRVYSTKKKFLGLELTYYMHTYYIAGISYFSYRKRLVYVIKT